MKQFVVFFFIVTMTFAWEYYSQDVKQALMPLHDVTRSVGKVAYFLTESGQKLGVDRRVVFRPKSSQCLQKILKQYSYRFQKNGEDIVLFVKDPKEAFDVANAIYESGCAIFSHPDFLITPKKRLLDPLFNPQQWNLYNYGQFYSKPDVDINAYEAWLFSKGKGVKVALIDDSFDIDHEDLKDAFVGGYDVLFQTADIRPDNGYEFHGTLCAGLIGARANGKGVIGVAPESKLYGIKLLVSDSAGNPIPLYTSDIVKAFLYASNADVINCSWGTYNVADNVHYVIDDLAKNGRNGKGIPIVFASGNEGMPQYYWEKDESALESVIAVGAVTNLGEHPWYSNYGPLLDFVAPGGGGTLAIATTDLRGSVGLAKGDYGHPDYTYANDSTGFNGTSAAAPQVTGVIALMLARDPELTKEEIVEILKKTAKKIGDVPYYNGRNDYFGYGLVDAKAALEEVIRRKALREITGKKYPIKGYFIHYGPGKFDWVYINSSLVLVAKLEGMDNQNGTLQWKILHFQKVEKRGNIIRCIGGNYIFSGKDLAIDGYFVRYGEGAYDWIYVSSNTLRVYKLEKMDYNHNILWIELSHIRVKIDDKSLFIINF